MFYIYTTGKDGETRTYAHFFTCRYCAKPTAMELRRHQKYMV